MCCGAHAAHVLAALGWLRHDGGAPSGTCLEAGALCWHFVLALWPVLYVSVYLL